MDGRIFGIAAVAMEARKKGAVAEIFPARTAKGALPAGELQPGDADAVPCVEPMGLGALVRYGPHDLMSRDDRQSRRMNIPFRRVKIGMTDSADMNAHQDFTRLKGRQGQLGRLQRVLHNAPGLPEHEGFHVMMVLRLL